MKKSILLGLIVLGSCSIDLAMATTNYSYNPVQTVQPNYNNQYVQQPMQYSQNQPLQGNVVMVPAGSSMRAMLTMPLSSATSATGQTVSMALNNDFYYDNHLIAPAGSTIYGTVIESTRAKRGGINGKLCVRFSQIFTPYGTQIPISAVIRTDDSSGVLVGGTKMDVAKEYTKDLAAGSAAGALSGVVFGARAGGEVGKGAALGTAVGAGGGLIRSLWDKGNDVDIPANASIDILLTQPISISTTPSYFHEN